MAHLFDKVLSKTRSKTPFDGVAKLVAALERLTDNSSEKLQEEIAKYLSSMKVNERTQSSKTPVNADTSLCLFLRRHLLTHQRSLNILLISATLAKMQETGSDGKTNSVLIRWQSMEKESTSPTGKRHCCSQWNAANTICPCWWPRSWHCLISNRARTLRRYFDYKYASHPTAYPIRLSYFLFFHHAWIQRLIKNAGKGFIESSTNMHICTKPIKLTAG